MGFAQAPLPEPRAAPRRADICGGRGDDYNDHNSRGGTHSGKSGIHRGGDSRTGVGNRYTRRTGRNPPRSRNKHSGKPNSGGCRCGGCKRNLDVGNRPYRRIWDGLLFLALRTLSADIFEERRVHIVLRGYQDLLPIDSPYKLDWRSFDDAKRLTFGSFPHHERRCRRE